MMQQRGSPNALGASFAQVNAPVAARMHEYVLARVLSHKPDSVVDGYSGSGELALALASAGVRVSAIELDSDASSHAGLRLPPGSKAISAKVEEVLPSLLPADVVVLNPPRTGVDGRVTEQLEQCDPAPRAIVYVSCNPATLARDLARMPRYRIATLRAYDMFPQTAHVETVCELVPLTA
jgi:23S rRNA (uracil1939-C5)-methyltransferase